MIDIPCSKIPDQLREPNTKLLKLDCSPKVDKKKGTTTSIWSKATYSHAVFSMAFSYKDNELPSWENNWHLEDNPWYVNLICLTDKCWL
jgi:hypothetical protein